MIQTSTSLKYEPSLELLRVTAEQLFPLRSEAVGARSEGFRGDFITHTGIIVNSAPEKGAYRPQKMPQKLNVILSVPTHGARPVHLNHPDH